MVEAEVESGLAHRDVKAELDERRIARGIAVGLPLLTGALAVAAGVTIGTAVAILVLAAGTLLGVIALFWASLRILSGEASLPPEIEALDATVNAVDALASRKKMLVRALKDLDNERALGKLEEEDHAQLSQTYRGELRETMARIDASLEPHRPKAEDAVLAYLARAGGRKLARRAAPANEVVDDEEPLDEDEEALEPKPQSVKTAGPKGPAPRLPCSKCSTSNEPDATFCKKCGTSLAKASTTDKETKSEPKSESEVVDEA
jgi:hypothetical protein